MQTPRLSATELASIKKALGSYALEQDDNKILGSRLGALLGQALRPRTLKEFGGLRKLVAEELHEAVRLEGVDHRSPDLVFTVIWRSDRTAPTVPPTEPLEVAGQDLWRIFSNPNAPSELVVNAQGVVLVLPPQTPPPEGYKALAKLTGEDFRQIAKEFSSAKSQTEVSVRLLQALDSVDFYKNFIEALRSLRTATENPLRDWEAVRADYVSRRLHDSLTTCGVSHTRAEEVVRLARPLVASRQKTEIVAPRGREESGVMPARDIAWLRKVLHEAIDIMSDADLKELKIPIPAGVLLEAAHRLPR